MASMRRDLFAVVGFFCFPGVPAKNLRLFRRLTRKKNLASQNGRQAMVPLENLLVIICDVGGITHLARASERENGNDRMYARDE